MKHLHRIIAMILLITAGNLFYGAYTHSEEYPSVSVETAQLKECYTRLEGRGYETYYCRFESVKTGQEQNTAYTRGAWVKMKSANPDTNFLVEVDYPERRSDNTKMLALGILSLFAGLVFGAIGLGNKKEDE